MPGDKGRVASASLSARPQEESKTLSSSSTDFPFSPTATSSAKSTPSLGIPQTSSSAAASLLTHSAPSITTSTSSLQPGSVPVNLPMATAPLAGVVPPLQMSNPQLAQLQVQNYLQLLLLQQNALLSSGAMPMLGLQGIANPLVGQVGGGQGGLGTSQAGLGTSEMSFPPPGFAPPGLTLNAAGGAGLQVPSSVAVSVENDQTTTSQTSQPGQTTRQLPVASAVTTADLVSSIEPCHSGKSRQTGLTDSTQAAVAYSSAPTDDRNPLVSTVTTITNNQPMSSSTHLVSNSTHSSEVAAIPSLSPEPTAVVPSSRSARDGSANGRSLRDRSSSSSVNSNNSSSLSSDEGSSRKSGSRGNSCLADSETEMRSQAVKGRKESLLGKSQLFYSGGSLSPAWAKEKAFVKRCVFVW